MKHIAKWCIEKTTFRNSNFITTLGALILALSFALPFFTIPYSMTSRTITSSELIAQFFIFKNNISSLLIAALLYSAALALAGFFIPKRFSAFLSAAGMILLSLSLYFTPVPVERFCGGIAANYVGLLLLLSGFLGNRR